MNAEKLFEQFVRDVARALAGSIREVSVRRDGERMQLDARTRRVASRRASKSSRKSSLPAPRTRGSGDAARKKIIQTLRHARGKYVAGADLAEATGLSLFTVRQHITRMRGGGIRISGKRGRGASGYRLG
jgi:biotin operon repressor